MRKTSPTDNSLRPYLIPLLGLSLLACGNVFSAPITIDSFSETLAPTTTNTFHDGSMIGGELDLGLSGANAEATVEITGGEFLISSVTNMSEENISLRYDGDDGDSNIDFTGLGGVDLTDGGKNDRFSFDISSLTGDIKITIQVMTDMSNWTVYTVEGITESGIVEIFFDDPPALVSGTGVDLSNVGNLSISIGVEQGEEMAINHIETRGPVDTIKPTVKITNKSTLKKTRRSHTVKGTASDAEGLLKVEVKVPGKSYKKAKLKLSGRFTFRTRNLRSGNNRIKVRSIDLAGNKSKVKKATAKGK